MLESLRSFIGGWVAKILLGLLVISFGVWGVSGSILGGTDQYTVGQVGETKVSISDFLASYTRNLNVVQQQVGQRLTQEQARVFGVETRSLSEVLSSATLDEFARANGMSLSDDTLARMLAENRAFQDSSGKFNAETFRAAIRNARMRESDFVDLQNSSAVRSQLTQAFASGEVLPSTFANALRAYSAEERKFSHVSITGDMVSPPATPGDEVLQKYFDANLKKYAAPEYRKLNILSIKPEDIADESNVSDDDVKSDYEARKSAYEKSEQRRVQQVVFPSSEKAEAAIKSMAEGTLFETMLTENGFKVSDVDLGLVEASKLPKVIREVAFAQELGSVSSIIEGPFGSTIVRVTEVTPASVTPLDDVKADIRKDLALRIAADSIISTQETIEDSRAGGRSLTEVGAQTGLKIRTINQIDRRGLDGDGGVVSDIPESSSVLEQAFQTEVGAQSSPLNYGSNGYVWYDVEDIIPARDRALEEVRNQVVTDWKSDQTAESVAKKADELMERLAKGAELETIAGELSTEVKTTAFLRRTGQEQGFPQTAARAGFASDAKTAAVTDGVVPGSRMIMVVTDTKGLEAEVPEPLTQQIQLANEGAADDLLNQLITNLQSDYNVTYNPDLIRQTLTRGNY